FALLVDCCALRCHLFFSFSCSADHRHLHSFPTRRSSDLQSAAGTGKRGPASCCCVFIAGKFAGKRLYPLVKELAAEGIPVVVSCRVLKLARQPYYRWLQQPVSADDLVAEYRAHPSFDAHRYWSD